MIRLKIMSSHPSVIAMRLTGLAGLVRLILHAPWWAWLLVALGIGAQMLNEYNLHRYIFHLPPPAQAVGF